MADELRIKLGFDDAAFKRQIQKAANDLARGIGAAVGGPAGGRAGAGLAGLAGRAGGFGMAAGAAALGVPAATAALIARETANLLRQTDAQRGEAAERRIGLGELRKEGRQDVVPQVIDNMKLVSEQFAELSQDLKRIRAEAIAPYADAMGRLATGLRRSGALNVLEAIVTAPAALARLVDPIGQGRRTADQQTQLDARARLDALRRLSFVPEGTRENVSIEIR